MSLIYAVMKFNSDMYAKRMTSIRVATIVDLTITKSVSVRTTMTKFIQYSYLCTYCNASALDTTVQDMYEKTCQCGNEMTLLSVSDSNQ